MRSTPAMIRTQRVISRPRKKAVRFRRLPFRLEALFLLWGRNSEVIDAWGKGVMRKRRKRILGQLASKEVEVGKIERRVMMEKKLRFMLFLAIGICIVIFVPKLGNTQAQVSHGKEEIPDIFCLSQISQYPWRQEVMACTGEDICFSGSVFYRWNSTIDNKGRVHYTMTMNDTSLRGGGTTTGGLYRRVGADTWTFYGDGEPPFVETYVSALNLVGDGQLKNLAWFYTWKITVNANGDVKVEKEN